MKNAILFHGYGDSPESFWLPYIRHELEARGYSVWAPQLPNTDLNIKTLLPYILQNGKFTSETVIISHSLGGLLTLAVLEKLSTKIKQAILVASFIEAKGKLEQFKPMLRRQYNWQAIREHVADFIVVNSDNDPWGCDDIQGRILFERVGGTYIVRHGEGHMGSVLYNQPYLEFPFLLKLID